ncbi:MAG TPA: HAMP domain-containing sensor histidine kinase, partial [Polyangiales bacterium]
LDAQIHRPRPISVGDLLEELEISATLEAKARGLELHVTRVPPDLYVLGDRPLLASAMANLLQNAMKFTHPSSTVKLRARSTETQVFLDVDDECGGVPEDKLERLFQPFEQHGHDMSGVGLGLPISRRAVVANGGELVFRNRPGIGCTFTAVLPRVAAPKERHTGASCP